jgi:hypothetical protein
MRTVELHRPASEEEETQASKQKEQHHYFLNMVQAHRNRHLPIVKPNQYMAIMAYSGIVGFQLRK